MEDIIPSGFGELLKTLRKQRRLTQKELALRLGVHRNTIGAWEHGDFLPESKTIVLELAKQLHLDTNETRSLLEASLTALSPYWQVPYQRNPFFTGREDVLHSVHTAFTNGHTHVLNQSYVISGLGGIGKTQTAVGYAYRYSNDYSAVFWIGADTSENITSGMVAIATVLNLPERQEPEQDKVVAAVLRWLNGHSGWLMIIDNVEDQALLKSILPAARHGYLLFTTRKQALGFPAQLLDMQPMTLEDGARFLLYRARLLDMTIPDADFSDADAALARKITIAMDGLPLALDQAGAYIESTRCSLSDYLQLFLTFDQRLLDEREVYHDHPLSVTKTFALAFEQLEQHNKLAADLLTVCAYLAPDAIPEAFFIDGAEHLGPTFEILAADQFQFNSAIKALLSYSLLQRNSANKTLMMHRLVQLVLKGRQHQRTQHMWIKRVLRTMGHIFPAEKTQVDYLLACERLLPHALLCVALRKQIGEGFPESVTLLNSVAKYLSYLARFAESESLFQQALQISEETKGQDHPDVANLLVGLTELYRDERKYEQAEALCGRALKIYEQSFGLEHLSVADTCNTLANLYTQQGKYEQAEHLYQRALHIKERAYGPDHLEIASPLNNLSMVYIKQGRYEQAESCCKRCLTIAEQSLGLEHHLVSYPLTVLADLCAEQGKYTQAESLWSRALAIREQTLGPEHPRVAETIHGLAEVYSALGQYEQAEPLYERALHIWEQAYGAEHSVIAFPLISLANIYREQSAYERAEPLYERALSLRQANLGHEHPDVAEALFQFARLRSMMQQIPEALALYQQALTIRERVLGLDHPNTRETRASYVHLLQTSG